jgi:hypothetical protein
MRWMNGKQVISPLTLRLPDPQIARLKRKIPAELKNSARALGIPTRRPLIILKGWWVFSRENVLSFIKVLVGAILDCFNRRQWGYCMQRKTAYRVICAYVIKT